MSNIGRVTVKSINRTTIASPNFTPKVNVAISDISGANVVSRQDGDTLIYNSITGEYETSPIRDVNVSSINGGRF